MPAWMATRREYDKKPVKQLYYLSAEFLMGRALSNNLINLGIKDEVKKVLKDMNINFNVIEDEEVDGIDAPLVEVGAFCNGECRGHQRLHYYPQVDRYLAWTNVLQRHKIGDDVFKEGPARVACGKVRSEPARDVHHYAADHAFAVLPLRVNGDFELAF